MRPMTNKKTEQQKRIEALKLKIVEQVRTVDSKQDIVWDMEARQVYNELAFKSLKLAKMRLKALRLELDLLEQGIDVDEVLSGLENCKPAKRWWER